MTLWGEVHKGLKNEKMIPISKVEECIFQLNKEMIATIVKQKEKHIKIIIIMIVGDYVLKFLIEHNYWFLGTDGGGNHHYFRSLMSQVGL